MNFLVRNYKISEEYEIDLDEMGIVKVQKRQDLFQTSSEEIANELKKFPFLMVTAKERISSTVPSIVIIPPVKHNFEVEDIPVIGLNSNPAFNKITEELKQIPVVLIDEDGTELALSSDNIQDIFKEDVIVEYQEVEKVIEVKEVKDSKKKYPCECGCGGLANPGCKYIRGHHFAAGRKKKADL